MVTTDAGRPSVLLRRAAALREALATAPGLEGGLTGAARELAGRLGAGGIVYVIGNGGATALAEHLTSELLGRLSADRERPPLAAASLCSDTAVLSAIAERSGFADCYAEQLRSAGRPQDALVIFTTSGRSPNLISAARVAGELGMYRLAFSGPARTQIDACEATVHALADDPGTVQECHLMLLHALVELVEDAMADQAAPSGEAA